mmetsp:Transcript_13263/g.23753  ORF Transcript_13263/g.23753 Transcript_13263/m.23753 type:complete len:316 (+) Transcript_13263:94-1041(+)|eukprot:CAMPEP_0196136994 /NCGR_PEP_ID=MMETSP0910-20130528/5122_1 /TAXON_ID=49265 /ORGANISM="Thalassiosira rotula, Strain GSO102" /LENGTH=315 /DNA_ID=CAMNT_0041397377 /DNA_START=52 /DNA_END=999 /DNA_ORIENTATION=+
MNNRSIEDAGDDANEVPPVTAPIAVAIPVSNISRITNNNITPPIATANLPQSDEEAQAFASAARDQGIATVRHHCDQHLEQNPDSSYVTWIATLHPENARVVIDPRFLIPNNPWMAVYEEASDDLRKGGRHYFSDDATSDTTVSPAPTAPPLDDDKDNDDDQEAAAGTKLGRSLIDVLIGAFLLLFSVSFTFSFELAASYCYLSYWLCSKIVASCSPRNMYTSLPLLVAFTIGQSFHLMDILLLFVSTIVVESIAAANYLLCTIFACSHSNGKSMHQITRKLPHLIRWAFRQKFEGWNPPRMSLRPYLADDGGTE